MARFGGGGGGGGGGTLVESDPVAVARLDALGLTFATDAEMAAAVSALQATDALKQDAATAATDAELASAKATIEAAMATDAELASAVATWSAANALKQDAATAATDAELAAGLAGKQDAATASTDAERDAAIVAALKQTVGGGRWTAGRWYALQGGSSQFAPADQNLLVSPIWVPPGQAFDSLGIQVTTAGEAAALIDFLLYDDLNTYPGAVLTSWLAVAGTSGTKQLDLPAPRVADKALYWFGARFYNSPTTRPTVRSAPGPLYGFSAPQANVIAALGSANNGWTLTGQAANPDPFPAGTTLAPGTNGVRVTVRAA